MTYEQKRELILKEAEERYVIRATHCRQERKIIEHLKSRFIEKKLMELEGNANAWKTGVQSLPQLSNLQQQSNAKSP